MSRLGAIPPLNAPQAREVAPPTPLRPIRALAISTTGMAQAVVTGTATTELIAARRGSRINLRWLHVCCRNSTDVVVTVAEGPIARWSIALNDGLGWWFELPIPPPDAVTGDMGGVVCQTPGNINYTGDAAAATLDLLALYSYVEYR